MAARDILFVIAMMILALLIWLVVPSWMIRRNMPKVINIFRKKNAVGIRNAKTIEELGLQPKSLLQRLAGPRDYKPRALDFLVQAKVVLMTEDHKFYITEETIANARWLKLQR